MSRSARYSDEGALVDTLEVHLRRLHPQSLIAQSIPLYSRCIDLVMYDDRGVHAVECKISHVARAIQQAARYRLGADFSYICLPDRRTFAGRLLALASDLGLGVWLCNDDGIEVLVDPVHSSQIWPPSRRRLEELVRCRSRDLCGMEPPQMPSTSGK